MSTQREIQRNASADRKTDSYLSVLEQRIVAFQQEVAEIIRVYSSGEKRTKGYRSTFPPPKRLISARS